MQYKYILHLNHKYYSTWSSPRGNWGSPHRRAPGPLHWSPEWTQAPAASSGPKWRPLPFLFPLSSSPPNFPMDSLPILCLDVESKLLVARSVHLVAGSAQIWLRAVSSPSWWCSSLQSPAMPASATLGRRVGVEACPPRASPDPVARQ